MSVSEASTLHVESQADVAMLAAVSDASTVTFRGDVQLGFLQVEDASIVKIETSRGVLKERNDDGVATKRVAVMGGSLVLDGNSRLEVAGKLVCVSGCEEREREGQIDNH